MFRRTCNSCSQEIRRDRRGRVRSVLRGTLWSTWDGMLWAGGPGDQDIHGPSPTAASRDRCHAAFMLSSVPWNRLYSWLSSDIGRLAEVGNRPCQRHTGSEWVKWVHACTLCRSLHATSSATPHRYSLRSTPLSVRHSIVHSRTECMPAPLCTQRPNTTAGSGPPRKAMSGGSPTFQTAHRRYGIVGPLRVRGVGKAPRASHRHLFR